MLAGLRVHEQQLPEIDGTIGQWTLWQKRYDTGSDRDYEKGQPPESGKALELHRRECGHERAQQVEPPHAVARLNESEHHDGRCDHEEQRLALAPDEGAGEPRAEEHEVGRRYDAVHPCKERRERLPVPREAEGVVDGGLRQHGEIHAEVPHRIEDQLDEGMGRVPERIDVCDGIRNEDRQGRGGKRPDEKRPRPAGRPQQPDEGHPGERQEPRLLRPDTEPRENSRPEPGPGARRAKEVQKQEDEQEREQRVEIGRRAVHDRRRIGRQQPRREPLRFGATAEAGDQPGNEPDHNDVGEDVGAAPEQHRRPHPLRPDDEDDEPHQERKEAQVPGVLGPARDQGRRSRDDAQVITGMTAQEVDCGAERDGRGRPRCILHEIGFVGMEDGSPGIPGAEREAERDDQREGDAITSHARALHGHLEGRQAPRNGIGIPAGAEVQATRLRAVTFWSKGGERNLGPSSLSDPVYLPSTRWRGRGGSRVAARRGVRRVSALRFPPTPCVPAAGARP